MKKKIKLVIVGAVTLLATRGNATPTQTIWAPNDLLQPKGQWRVDSDVQFTLDKRQDDKSAQSPFVSEGITGGLFDNGSVGGEAGFEWWEPESQDNLKSPHIHFKFDVHEMGNFPSVALGFYNFGFKSNTTDENILYLGLGKTWDIPGHFFIAYYVGNQNVLVDENGNAQNNGFIISWLKHFPQLMKTLSLEADYQSSQSHRGALSFGPRWEIHQDSYLVVGYDIYNNSHLQRDTLNVQLSLGL